MNELQAKIGGPAAALDKAGLVSAAEQERALLTPELNAALDAARQKLLQAADDAPCPDALFKAAHEIRQFAACAERPSSGRLAHYLASYLTHCIDNKTSPAADVVRPLVRAIDQSFTATKEDAILKAIVEDAGRLMRRFGIAA